MATESKTVSKDPEATSSGSPVIQNELLDRIMYAASIGVGIVCERILKEVNPCFCEMLGYSPDELVGKSSSILYPDCDEFNRVGKDKYDQINSSGKGTVETNLVRKDGRVLDIRLSSVPLDPGDLSQGVVFTALDITEKNQALRDLQTSRDRNTNLIKTTPMGILIYQLEENDRLVLKDVNPATTEILGKDYSDSTGKEILEVFPNLRDTGIPESYIGVAKTGKTWATTNFLYKDELITGAYDIVAFRISPGQVAVMFNDITPRIQTEQKLRQSEEKHRLIYQNIQDVYFELDPDTTILEVSPSLSKISSYSPEELIGQKIDILSVDEEFKQSFLNELFESGELRDFDIPLKDKDGRRIYCSVNISVSTDENGEPVKIIGSLRDTTERTLAREQISKLERAVEQSPSCVLISDLQGNIEYVNPRFCEVSGYSMEDVLGKKTHILVTGNDNQRFLEGLRNTIDTGESWKGEFYNKRKDGTMYWERASISPVRNQENKVTHVIAILDDITDSKIREHELKEAKERAVESERLKSAFIANMSHEIRTPMNAILGFSELLRNNDIHETERMEYINMISSRGNELMDIISDLIELSRMEAGDMKIDKKELRVSEFVSDIYEQFHNEKKFRGKDLIQIRLRCPEDSQPVILSDKYRLQQVFNNLLSNALKFTHEGYIEIGFLVRNDEVNFYVKDSGIGIKQDKQEIIFERFRQADDSMTRKYGGTGLGLAISKQIVELLGGKIWVESNTGQGSTFLFSQPTQMVKQDNSGLPEMSEVYAAEQELSLEGRRILIAEDEPANYLFLQSMLGSSKAELIWAKDGKQAVDLHSTIGHIDLVLMDIRMPTLNGLLATREIRSVDPDVPIIALTAFAFPDDQQKSFEAGCNEHLNKPIRVEDLKDVIRKYLDPSPSSS